MSDPERVIPFFSVDDGCRRASETREEVLAREMGRPPWEIETVPASQTVRTLRDRYEGASAIGLIFDPCFGYSSRCWRQWVEALLREGDVGYIHVPLGNQNPSWLIGLDIPQYLTLTAFEGTATFRGPQRWIERRSERIEDFCVAVVPISTLRALPDALEIGGLREFWVKEGQILRVFCEGWLHSFNALRDAGCRRDLLGMCDWHGRVLELGCDCGLMAQTCREMGFDVDWVGIDQNHKGLVQARGCMDMAIQADLSKPLPLSPSFRFDRIVCADVLEHLPYPWDLLADLRDRIVSDGLLVASVPNVGHWSVVEALLGGRWDETPSGLLCVTHLRFGTKQSWTRWLEKSGWHVVAWEKELVPLPEGWMLLPEGGRNLWDRDSLETVRFRFLAKVKGAKRVGRASGMPLCRKRSGWSQGGCPA